MTTAMTGQVGEAEPESALPLAVLVYDDSIAADAILAQAAQIVARSGLRLGGMVQTNVDRPGRSRCAMTLTDLSSGEVIPISQDLGEEASGCRLDTAALAHASLAVERALRAGVDLVILNKFGKQEAQGQGFRSVIAEALLTGVPVVTGVTRLNLGACLDFAGGPVTHLAADADAIAAWCRQAAGPCSGAAPWLARQAAGSIG
jgi:nucleoside-triphosphatase THEP1